MGISYDDKYRVNEFLRLLRYFNIDNGGFTLYLDNSASFPCSWFDTKNPNNAIQIGNNIYTKIIVTKNDETVKGVIIEESVVKCANIKITLASNTEAVNMKKFIEGSEKNIYGIDTKSITVNGEIINLNVITDGIDKLYLKLLRNKSYYGLSTKERTILDVPIIQWKLNYPYGSYFIFYWLMGYQSSKGNMLFSDNNVNQLLMQSSVFKTALNKGVAEINKGTIYTDDAAQNSRTNLCAIKSDQECSDNYLPDYGDYSKNINCFTQVNIGPSDCISGGEIIKEDFVNAIASVAIRYYFVGDVIYGGFKNTVNITSVKWRIYDSFNFGDKWYYDQDLGNWQRSVFKVYGPKMSLVFDDKGYVPIENPDFISLYNKISGKKSNDDKTDYDFDVITKSIEIEGITIKGYTINSYDYTILK